MDRMRWSRWLVAFLFLKQDEAQLYVCQGFWMENLYKEVDEIKGIYGEPASSLEYFGILWIPKFLKFKIVTTSMCISLSSMS